MLPVVAAEDGAGCSVAIGDSASRPSRSSVPDPSWTVIEIATGEALGTFDSEADVALCLAFAKLSRDEVEVIADVSPMASLTAPSWW